MAKDFKKRAKGSLKYIPKVFEGEENPLIFEFRVLSNKEIAKIDDRLAQYNMLSGKIVSATNEVNYETALSNLIGWENLEVDDIKIEFDKTLLEEIDIVDELVELGDYIYLVSKYPDIEIKY